MAERWTRTPLATTTSAEQPTNSEEACSNQRLLLGADAAEHAHARSAGGRKWRSFRNSDWRGRVDVVSWDAHVYCFVLKQ
jgi:hypothetical protein